MTLPHSLRVLVVEDDDDSREVLRALIQCMGPEPMVARDASEALACAREQMPDIGLIDVSLPGIDGCELARQLRSLAGRKIRLIAVTGHLDPAIRNQAKAAGFDEYWVKPIAGDAISSLLGLSVRAEN